MKKPLALLGFGAAVAAAGWFGARNSPRDPVTRRWYDQLEKPPFQPPDAVFPVVWTALYSLMAVSGWRVWNAESSAERSRSLRIWATQLIVNAEWTHLFFGLHRPKQSLADVVTLESLIVSYIATADQVDRAAAICFVPYAAWVAFATLLNSEIVRLNPDAANLKPQPAE